MILKWINLAGNGNTPDVLEQGAREERKSRNETKLVDVAHEALSERAARDRADLDGLVRMGWPNVQRERFMDKVRKKVWGLVREGFGGADDEMVEEITERLADAAEADPLYKGMFDRT